MKNTYKTFCSTLLSVFLFSLSASGVCAGEAPRDPKQNAALQYWLAFALLPNSGAADAKVFAEKTGERLTEATRTHLSQAKLFLLRRGAAMPYCEWGLSDEDGPGMLLPHLSKARHLGRMIAFGFQLKAEDGKADDGVQDLAAGFAFSRHVAADGLLISFLVHCAIDSILIDRAAFFLPQLDKVHLKQLADALDRLPHEESAAEAVRSERRVFGNWMKVHLTAALEKKEPGEVLQGLGLDARVMAGITKENILAQLSELDRFYDQMAELHTLPLDEFQKKLPELEAQVKKAGALTQLCLPALSRIRSTEVGGQVRFRMFRAAVDVLLEGPVALARHPDPYDGKLFGHKVTENGFELTSNLKVNEKAITVTVGGKLGTVPKPEAAQPQGDPPPKAPEF
jgi:hypothetical protein